MKNRIGLLVPALAAARTLFAPLPAARAADIYGAITFKGTPPPEINIVPLKTLAGMRARWQQKPTTQWFRKDPKPLAPGWTFTLRIDRPPRLR